ncbi:acetyl esterase [Chryseobacterium ureilyticum]|uniref:Acetyl esterase n=1 Tax=Chryseobacterium ureilyticum TaxID=373668 RepID=A0A1N7Q9D0_9FLAO|nr:alpha/beta hydrolase [Chryseobacterium ureilyticum]SIT19217.1 acetyl esterase [Chryseobacterium ureilyticum]
MTEKIDPELWQSIINSPYNQINYENLLIHDPSKIREEEMNVSLKEDPLPIPTLLSVENIHIPSSDPLRNIRLRIYKPKGQNDLPILLYFHGGAFIYGTPEQYDFIFFRLALDVNMMIVSVDYRLAPKHPFPAAIEDGYDALLWLSENANQLHGNKNNIMIGGSSAGATIAASITHWIRDTKSVEIQHQYLLYPPMDHHLITSSMNKLANAPMQTKVSAQWMWKHYLNNQLEQPPQYSVPLMEKNFNNLPDATIIVCEFDPLKDEGKAYAKRLQQAGTPTHLIEIENSVHTFDFFSCSLSERFYTKQVELFKHILNKKK